MPLSNIPAQFPFIMTNTEPFFSWSALARIVLMAVAVLLLWMARGAFAEVIVATVFAVALFPLVGWLTERLHLSHPFAVLAAIGIVVVPFVLVGIALLPFINDATNLLAALFKALALYGIIPKSLQNFNVVSYFQSHTLELLASGQIVIQAIVTPVTIFVLSFYLIYDYERLLELFLDLFPEERQPKIKNLLEEISTVVSAYIRGNFLISVLCTVIVSIGLLALQIPYAIPLGIFAGIIDLLPLVGSIIGAIPAIILAFSISSWSGVMVIALFVLYQQIESIFISPLIYNKALNISSALSFISVVVGAELFGILGAFLALPVAASIPVLIKYRKALLPRPPDSKTQSN